MPSASLTIDSVLKEYHRALLRALLLHTTGTTALEVLIAWTAILGHPASVEECRAYLDDLRDRVITEVAA